MPAKEIAVDLWSGRTRITRDTSWLVLNKDIFFSGETSDNLRLVLCPGELDVQSWSTLESTLK